MEPTQTDSPSPVPEPEFHTPSDTNPRPRVKTRLLIGIGLIVAAAVGTVVLLGGFGKGAISTVGGTLVLQIEANAILRDRESAPMAELMGLRAADLDDEEKLGAFFDRQIAAPSGIVGKLTELVDRFDLDYIFEQPSWGGGWRALSPDRRAEVKQWCLKATAADFLGELIADARADLEKGGDAKTAAERALFEVNREIELELGTLISFSESGEIDGELVIKGSAPGEKEIDAALARLKPKLLRVLTDNQSQLSPSESPDATADAHLARYRNNRSGTSDKGALDLRMRMRKSSGKWRVTMGWSDGQWVYPRPPYVPNVARAQVEFLVKAIGEDGTTSNVEKAWTTFVTQGNTFIDRHRREFIEHAREPKP